MDFDINNTKHINTKKGLVLKNMVCQVTIFLILQGKNVTILFFNKWLPLLEDLDKLQNFMGL